MESLSDRSIVYLNMANVALVARFAALDARKNPSEKQRDELIRIIRAKEHIKAAISYVEYGPDASVQVPLELPF